MNFIKQLGLYLLNFLRVGTEIKCEETWHQALHLACADIISQPHLLANANKETRSQIAARFINQFQRVPIRTQQTRAPKSNHDYALRFVFAAFNSLRFAQRHGRLCVSQRKRARLHLAERLLDKLLHFSCLNISKDVDYSVLRDNVTITEFDEIFLR